jgi:hypothetical protein
VDDHRHALSGILQVPVTGDAKASPFSLKLNRGEQSVAAGICGLATKRNQESSCRTVIEGESYAAIDGRSADTPNQRPGISDR